MLGWVEFLGFLEERIVAPVREFTADSAFILKVEPTGYPERLDTGGKEERKQRFSQGLWSEQLEG